MNRLKKTRFIPIHMPPPPSVMNNIIKVDKKQNKAKYKARIAGIKPTLREKYQFTKQHMKVICEQNIPLLQNLVHQKDAHIAHLESIVRDQEEMISRKAIISRLKDDEIRNMKMELHKKMDNGYIGGNCFDKSQQNAGAENFEMSIKREISSEDVQELQDTNGGVDRTTHENTISEEAISGNETTDNQFAAINNDHRDSNLVESDSVLDSLPPEIESEVTDNVIGVDHDYCLKLIRSQNSLQCSGCGYTAKHKSHLKKHQIEHCNIITQRKKKEMRTSVCPICEKKYTHDGLRSHLRNYKTKNQVFRGLHAAYSTEQHSKLLEDIVTIKTVK